MNTPAITAMRQAVQDMKEDNVRVNCLRKSKEIKAFTEEITEQEI